MQRGQHQIEHHGAVVATAIAEEREDSPHTATDDEAGSGDQDLAGERRGFCLIDLVVIRVHVVSPEFPAS